MVTKTHANFSAIRVLIGTSFDYLLIFVDSLKFFSKSGLTSMTEDLDGALSERSRAANRS